MRGTPPPVLPGNPWDALSAYFDTSKDEDEIPAGAADNVLIAGPVFFRFIDSAFPGASGRRALDFGCGTGGFAHALHRRGFRVTGVDPSPAMIERARSAYGDEVEFHVGDASALRGGPASALITAIMALQFVADIASALVDLVSVLEPGGHLIFAVHNPAFFQGDVLRFGGGVEVPIFIRTAEEYHALARNVGLVPRLAEEPSFTEVFLARYPVYAGRPPEYLILGYEKRRVDAPPGGHVRGTRRVTMARIPDTLRPMAIGRLLVLWDVFETSRKLAPQRQLVGERAKRAGCPARAAQNPPQILADAPPLRAAFAGT